MVEKTPKSNLVEPESNSRLDAVEMINKVVLESKTDKAEADETHEVADREAESNLEDDDTTDYTASYGTEEEEEEETTPSEMCPIEARKNELKEQAAAEIRAVQELKLFIEESSEIAERRKELAAEAAIEIEDAKKYKDSILSRLSERELEEEEEEEVSKDGSHDLKGQGKVDHLKDTVDTSEISAAEEEGSTDPRKGEDFDESFSRMNNRRALETVGDGMFKMRPKLETPEPLGISMRGLSMDTLNNDNQIRFPLGISMRGLSIGTLTNDHSAFNSSVTSFDEVSNDRGGDCQQFKIDNAEIENDTGFDGVDKANISVNKKQNADNRKDVVEILEDKDWYKDFNIVLSDIQMLQSLKMALEADSQGLLEFRTVDHLSELESVPLYSLRGSEKGSCSGLGSRIIRRLKRLKSSLYSGNKKRFARRQDRPNIQLVTT